MIALLLVVLTARAETPFEAAQALIKAKRYPEAKAALEQIVAADPKHAGACHALGMLLRTRSDPAALEEAVKWLGQAAQLEPSNPRYLGDFGGSSLQLASRTRSISAASQGREAMEKAVALDPGYLDARQGLFEYYTRAPWPLGSSAKAAAHLEEIRKRDPTRALLLSVNAKVAAKDYAGAFKICDELLAKDPADYTALYYLGRTSSLSGQQLERGLAALQKCLTIAPPSPASPSHSNVWNRIGTLQEKLNRPAEARAAYAAALQLDSANQQARDALARLR